MDVYYKTESINEEKAKISCELLVESVRNQEFEVEVASYTKQKVQVKKGRKTYNFEFEIKNPKLWWPNGSGEQHLYEMILQIRKDNKLISADTQNIGLRTIELVNEADSIGTSFYFKVNGKPIFMKGANYIPQDVFLTRVTNKQYEQLIQKVKDANMNMIRVWGGGVYEKEIFYDLCDQHGILVWQDFMFAGTIYPNLLELSLTIKDEVQQQVKRIRKHPCLALWCGNNEIEVAWHNWGWQKQYNYSVSDSMKLWNNYIYHFENLFPKIIEDLNPEIPYVPTSPQSNWGTKENFNHGSMHYWGVWHGKDAFEEFENNVGRFMVEFGFQSFPSIETLKKVVDEEMLFLESDCMQSRQKSYVGNGLILEQIEKYYHTPKDFYEFVELSQKVQAKALQMAIEAHITNQPHCMGTLLWQLNDCWPGPSWSIIDFYGEEKEGYRVMRECFKK
jgi:beta-mannosidase